MSTLLLDTHVWVWLMNRDVRLGKRALRRIEQGVPSGDLRVSIISVWEVAMLENKERLTFTESCEDWTASALTAPGIHLIELTTKVAISSTRLPGEFHGDPADRILIATARDTDAVLITADKAILRYAKTGHVKTIAADK